MGMPEIPSGANRPDLNEAAIDLLESIALEEMAIAHLLNAEAEQLQAFVGDRQHFPTNPTNAEIFRFNTAIGRVLETLLFKEMYLLRKLEAVLQLRLAGENEE